MNSPIDRVFDLSRSIDVHLESQQESQEQAIAGRTSGLIGPGECVTWQARHFGVRLTHTAKITGFDRPNYFQDTMTRGVFRSFVHDHYFETSGAQTIVRDILNYESPLGICGRLADALFLKKYLTRLLADRNRQIAAIAESERWRQILIPVLAPDPPMGDR